MANQITLFADHNFQGASVVITCDVNNLGSYYGFNDKASSAIVEGDWWVVYRDANYKGLRAYLGPGKWPDLGVKDLNDAVSSVRPASQEDADLIAAAAADPTNPEWM